MKLSTLLGAWERAGFAPQVEGEAGRAVADVCTDSRAVREGALFVALRGSSADGHRFLATAVERGARSLLVEEDYDGALPESEVVSVVRVRNTRAALAHGAAEFFGHPGRSVRVVGVTGTNGKTTTTFLLEAIAKAQGWEPGVIGTVNQRYRGHVETLPNTTPESLELQRLLARMRDAGVNVAFLEVSSHALVTHRVDGLPLEAGIFLNLSQDHLDFHGSMEAYLEAKSRLVSVVLPWSARALGRPTLAVVNVGDPAGERVARAVGEGVTGAWFDARAGAAATWEGAPVWRAQGVELGPRGTRLVLAGPGAEVKIDSQLLGGFNVENVAAAACCALGLGASAESVAQGIGALEGVPGRLERVSGVGSKKTVVVDFAHTPKAVEKVLQNLRGLGAQGRVVAVLGCGGDRDQGKRPQMGEAAARGAELVVVTSDNPRSEEPAQIAAQVAQGALGVEGARLWEAGGALGAGAPWWAASPNERGGLRMGDGPRVVVELSRRRAVALAVGLAGPQDVVVLAGKGHEPYQEQAGVRYPMSDVEEARASLEDAAGRRVVETLSALELAAACGAQVVGEGVPAWRDRCAGVITDSREVVEGAVFVALVGERLDAHGFLAQAVERGACALVVQGAAGEAKAREAWGARPGLTLVVEDTLRALGDMARAVLCEVRRRKPWFAVAAITGSNGKTTTKELLAALMVDAVGLEPWQVWKTPGNYNNLIGVPLSVFGLRWGHEALVLEHGANMLGEIARMIEISEADVRVLTSVAEAHLKGFGSLRGVYEAKSEIFSRFGAGCEAVLPASVAQEVPWVDFGEGGLWVAGAPGLEAQRLGFVSGRAARGGSVGWSAQGQGARGQEVAVRVVDAPTLEVDSGAGGEGRVFGGAAREAALGLPLVGEHNAGNAALAWAAAQAMGRRMGRVGGAQGKVELVSLALPSGRLGFREGTGAFAGVQVLDDSYNANPGSMRAGLRVLAELAQRSGGRAIAVLGDMLELGAEAEALHREVGRCAGELGVWGLVAFGAWSQALAEGCREARGQGWALATDGGGDEAVEQAVARLREQARAGDTILIKGSRGARMERIVHRLTTQER